jgi:hypothetical protein
VLRADFVLAVEASCVAMGLRGQLHEDPAAV